MEKIGGDMYWDNKVIKNQMGLERSKTDLKLNLKKIIFMN